MSNALTEPGGRGEIIVEMNRIVIASHFGELADVVVRDLSDQRRGVSTFKFMVFYRKKYGHRFTQMYTDKKAALSSYLC